MLLMHIIFHLSDIINIFSLQTVDNDLALKIYIKARATPKVVAAFAERREFDKILIYSKQVKQSHARSLNSVVHMLPSSKLSNVENSIF